MTIALSIDRILENIYALAALDSCTRRVERPGLLGRGQATALRRVITCQAARLVYSLLPVAQGTSLSNFDDNHDIIEIELDTAEGEEQLLYSGLRPLLESAVANATMAAVWAPSSALLAETYTTMFDELMALATRSLALHSGNPGRVRPAV